MMWLDDFIDLFNCSLLAQQLVKKYSVHDFLKILKGMNGNHTSIEKGAAMGVEDIKMEAAIQDLREETLAGKWYMVLVHYLAAWNMKKIAEAEGEEA
jgi:hydrogenase maturation factor